MTRIRIAPLAAFSMFFAASLLAFIPAHLFAQDTAPDQEKKKLAEGMTTLKTNAEAFSVMQFSDKVVTDKPYTADAVTETVQTLSDGNRIVRQNQTKYYRDSAGRTRREQTIGTLGPSSPEVSKQIIFISDPVAKVDYTLNPATKTARKMNLPSDFEKKSSTGGVIKYQYQYQVNGASIAEFSMNSKEGQQEDLGKQTINGLSCNGTRVTRTIPAGQIGNELPIVSVRETWYSQDIEAVVQSKSSDPRFGDVTYNLNNIQLGEQSQQLFVPPTDYKVETSEQPQILFKSKMLDEQKQ